MQSSQVNTTSEWQSKAAKPNLTPQPALTNMCIMLIKSAENTELSMIYNTWKFVIESELKISLTDPTRTRSI